MLMMADVLAGGGDWGPGGWWPIFPLFWLLLWGTVIFVIFRSRGRWGHQRGQSAEDLLAERYARGEIAEDEYRERLNVLKGPR